MPRGGGGSAVEETVLGRPEDEELLEAHRSTPIVVDLPPPLVDEGRAYLGSAMELAHEDLELVFLHLAAPVRVHHVEFTLDLLRVRDRDPVLPGDRPERLLLLGELDLAEGAVF